MRREDVQEGVYVHLLADDGRIPAGTLGIVETVTTSREGDFCFTLRWLDAPSGTRYRPISDRSLNLWLSDLEKFEAVSGEDARSILSVRRPNKPTKPIQLRLFEDL